MSVESYLEAKLQRFSILDLSLVKSVYFVFGLLLCSLYPKLLMLNWWFYLILVVLCALPLEVHLFSQKGNLIEKMTAYLKTNNPSNQVLLFLSVFFFSAMIAVLLPFLTYAYWWVYVILMVCLAIKPLQTSWFW
jgi:hypothetical protein